MTDNNQTLPPEEFDVRGCRGDIGLACPGAVGVYADAAEGALYEQKLLADRASAYLNEASRAIEALKVIDGETQFLRQAAIAVHEAFLSLGEHDDDRRLHASVRPDAPLNDAAVLANMFGGYDQEDVELAAAAAALGSAHSA